MINITRLREQKDFKILAIGSHPIIVQSMLDFDYIAGKQRPSIAAILAGGRNNERYFFGRKEILIPVFEILENIPLEIKNSINLFLNLASSRRVLESSLEALKTLPNILGGAIFAENVAEAHAIQLYNEALSLDKFIVGPASVGLIIPGKIKLGAIGGIDIYQLVSGKLFSEGNVAVFSSSGGMTNELINIVTGMGKRLSFAMSFGGDRFPVVTPLEGFMAAQNDTQTETIVYFGELGGYDEYEIAKAIKEKKITKQVICYIAGVISDVFAKPPQFGHAKAMAAKGSERAVEKRKALKEAGAFVADSFDELVKKISQIQTNTAQDKDYANIVEDMQTRQHALIATSISRDEEGIVKILGEDLLSFANTHSFAYETVSMFLGRKIKSKNTEEFVDFVLRLLVDHGPYVSGAVNTIVTARAGRDLVSSLAAGLLTIGPRFGGAINQAAGNWLSGVNSGRPASDFVEDFAKKKQYIPGIGHRKYRIDFPDPRVTQITKFADRLQEKKFTNFAKEIEKITVDKKGNLILNVDGAIAAVFLDILTEEEGLTSKELEKLVDNEFFNALFVLSRSVGFISHFLDQKRLDEGLFRLTEDQVAQA